MSEKDTLTFGEKIIAAHAKAFELGERQAAIRDTFYREIGGERDYWNFWCEAILDGHLIVADGAGARWAYPYTVSGVTVSFGEPIEAERQYILTDGNEAKATELPEEEPAGDGAGSGEAFADVPTQEGAGDGAGFAKTFDTPEEEVAYVKSLAISEEGGANILRVIQSKSLGGDVVAGNYMFLWGSEEERDLENEWFSKATNWESDYTQGLERIPMDWEHGRAPDNDVRDGKGHVDGPGRHDIIAYADMKSAVADENGLWVERVLNRSSRYMEWVKTLLDAGMLATSSEPVQEGIMKSANGHIDKWPLYRDSMTVTPMEWRMRLNGNVLKAAKALCEDSPEFKALLEAKGIDLTEVEDVKGEADLGLARRKKQGLARLKRIRASLS